MPGLGTSLQETGAKAPLTASEEGEVEKKAPTCKDRVAIPLVLEALVAPGVLDFSIFRFFFIF